MPPALSSADVTRYWRDGFLSPNRALTAAEAATCRAELAAFERTIGPLTVDQTARHRSPLVMRCIDDYLARRRFPLDLLYHHSP